MKNIKHKRFWIWALLFSFVVTLLALLAAGWNVVMVRDYHRMLEMARSLSLKETERAPWISLVVGSIGFALALLGLVLFFVRLVQEMRLNQKQSEFLATVTHELKTPVATIELCGGLIRGGGLTPDEVEKLWQSHDNELKRLKSEIESILEAARWTSAEIQLNLKKVPIESWLSESLARWQGIVGINGSLERVGEPLNCHSYVDLKMLNLISDNLLDNARKFAKGAPRVTVRTRMIRSHLPRRPDRWQISIEDEGWGFDPKDSGKIFKRFTRARTKAPYAIPGTGLGLYVAANASRLMGIDLKADSPGLGKGAVFTIEGKDQLENG